MNTSKQATPTFIGAQDDADHGGLLDLVDDVVSLHQRPVARMEREGGRCPGRVVAVHGDGVGEDDGLQGLGGRVPEVQE